MKIKVIGRWQSGKPLKCDACMELERLIKVSLEELGRKDIPVELCVSEEEYNSYGVVATPALVINDKLKMAGKVPPKEMLKEFLRFELKKEEG
jgi:hypothetical protein